MVNRRGCATNLECAGPGSALAYDRGGLPGQAIKLFWERDRFDSQLIGNASGQSGAGPPHSKVAPGDLTGGVFDFQQVGTDARGSQHQAYYCLGILNLAVGDHFQSLRDWQSHNLENFVVFKPLLRRG